MANDNLIRIWKPNDYYSGHVLRFCRRQLLGLFCMVFLILMLAACSSSNAAPKASTTPAAQRFIRRQLRFHLVLCSTSLTGLMDLMLAGIRRM